MALNANAQDACSYIAGGAIIANDGKYLGKAASEYDSESVLNKYGHFGSEYSSDSIWNKYGSYGSEYSSNSPFNPYSNNPPVIVKNGRAVAYLSVNEYLGKATINPYYIKSCHFY